MDRCSSMAAHMRLIVSYGQRKHLLRRQLHPRGSKLPQVLGQTRRLGFASVTRSAQASTLGSKPSPTS